MSDNKGTQKRKFSVMGSAYNVKGFLIANNGTDAWKISQYSAEILYGNDIKPDLYIEYEKEKVPAWNIDQGGEKYRTWKKTYTKGHVNDCVFAAVKIYMQATGLGTLTKGDRDFFEDHPLVESSGVSRAHVLTVVHGLVVPWGIGVDRVFLPKESYVGDTFKDFVLELGMNPQAILDGSTTNSEFAELIGIPVSEINDKFRFEFVDTPPRPSVIMRSSTNTQSKKKNTGNVGGAWSVTVYGMGHADFAGPRDSASNDWVIAFTLARNPKYNNGGDIDKYSSLDAFSYIKQPEPEITKELQAWDSVVKGKTISEWKKEKDSRSPNTNAIVVHSDTAEKKDGGTPKECPKCGGTVRKNWGYAYCINGTCDWEEIDEEEIQHGTIDPSCPICGGDMFMGLCSNCGYDTEILVESGLATCSKHNGETVYFTRDRDPGQEMVYICPECLKAEDGWPEDTNVTTFISDGMNHKARMIFVDTHEMLMSGGVS